MAIAYFDCFAGISGDMILGALVDAGLSVEELSRGVKSLDLESFNIEAREVESYGLRGTKVEVKARETGVVRTYQNIRTLIEDSELPPAVRESSLDIFALLAEAEAKIHGKPVGQIHFHEIGAVDSIVDIVGATYGFHLLGVTDFCCSPLPLGTGMIKTAHGSLPVPVPAVMEILQDTPTYGKGIPTEIVTPTGAATVKSLCTKFEIAPPMVAKRVGYGAGSRELGIPNLLRIIIGEPSDSALEAEEPALVISTNIDDMNPEFYEFVMGRLFEEGAQDVWLSPIQMKKTRPGMILNVLCSPESAPRMKEILLKETSTLGLRTSRVNKLALARETLGVETPWGAVMVKLGKSEGRVLSVSPEFEDCARLAQEHNVPVKEIYQHAIQVARSLLEKK